MAISKLKITFPQNLIIGSTVAFNLKYINTGIEIPLVFTWVLERQNPYEVTKLPDVPLRPGRSSAIAFMNSFQIDNPEFDIVLGVGVGFTDLVITSEIPNITFTGGTSNLTPGQSSEVTFEITRTDASGIIINGLESDNYLINNEVWIGLSVIENISQYSVSFNNLNNGKNTNSFVIFTSDNKSNINITPILKSIFDYPNVSNQNKIQINIQAYNGSNLLFSSSIVKNFIRGGNRTELINQNIPFGTILRNSIKLPIWDSFPTDEYYLSNDGTIQIRPFSEINISLKDFRRVKGCNNLYFKFLNQKGGYSNWLFESFSKIETNANLGAYVRNNNIEDLGNEVDNSLSVYSKVPAEYIGLIKDLFVSPEIYVWKELRWVRVFSGKNTSDEDIAKRAYTIKAKFDFENRFNASLLWSN